MFGDINASAFYIRHVKNLEMHHIDVSYLKDDARPNIVLEDVAGADFQHMKIQRFPGINYFSINNVTDFSTQFVQSLADSKRDKIAKEVIKE